jgi:hypothetical protein
VPYLPKLIADGVVRVHVQHSRSVVTPVQGVSRQIPASSCRETRFSDRPTDSWSWTWTWTSSWTWSILSQMNIAACGTAQLIAGDCIVFFHDHDRVHGVIARSFATGTSDAEKWHPLKGGTYDPPTLPARYSSCLAHFSPVVLAADVARGREERLFDRSARGEITQVPFDRSCMGRKDLASCRRTGRSERLLRRDRLEAQLARMLDTDLGALNTLARKLDLPLVVKP